MNTILCPQCDCVMPTEAGVPCAFCGWTETGVADSESQSMQGPELPREQFTFSSAQGLIRFMWSAPAMTTIGAGLLAAFFGAFCVCLAIGGRAPAGGMVQLLLAVLGFFAVSWCFVAVAAFPLTFIYCLFGRARTAWVEGKQLHSRIGRKLETFDLEECKWSTVSSTGYDSRGYYRGSSRPRLAVQVGKQVVGLGFTEEAAARWIEFFEAERVDRFPRIPWLRFLVIGMITTVVGGTIGFLFERLIPLIGGPAMQPGALMFLGVLDGVFLAVVYLAVRYRPSEMGRRLGILLMMLIFFGFAYKWVGVLAVAVANAAIGAFLSWLLLPRDEANGIERDSAISIDATKDR